jgi:Flp pilus assembly protein CpaB
MDRKKVILLVAALLIAAVTALMARSMFNGASAPESTAAAAPAPVPAGPKVLVATKALPVGTIITADSVRYQPWPKELIEAAYFKEGDGGASIESLVGTVVRNAVTAGQPLTQGSIVKPGDRGFLAAALGPGMRAVTVPVSALTGVAGFVFPGDRVDLVLTAIELGFLTERRAAFENLAYRVNLDSIRGVVTTMIQTEKYGTPLASALRVLSAEFRNERMMRAEEKAARLPAIMTVPLILFILPTLFIVIIGPAACSIGDAFSKQ